MRRLSKHDTSTRLALANVEKVASTDQAEQELRAAQATD
jgi:hypothetical protein